MYWQSSAAVLPLSSTTSNCPAAPSCSSALFSASDDAGRIAAVAGVVVRVTGVDLPWVRAVEFPILLPIGGVGQVPLDEGVRGDPEMPIACSSITALMLSQPFTQRSVWSM